MDTKVVDFAGLSWGLSRIQIREFYRFTGAIMMARDRGGLGEGRRLCLIGVQASAWPGLQSQA